MRITQVSDKQRHHRVAVISFSTGAQSEGRLRAQVGLRDSLQTAAAGSAFCPAGFAVVL